jgi:hypothetical protein
MEACKDRLVHSTMELSTWQSEGIDYIQRLLSPILPNADGYQKEIISPKSLQSAMIVPTRAIARAPQAPIPLRFVAPLVLDVLVAVAPLPWKVVPVTTWPLMVVVTVETPEVGVAVEAMVVLQSVHVPVNEVQGTP